MNAIHSVMHMHARNKYTWFITPWIVVMGSFVIGLLISVLIGVNGGLYSGGVSSIYVFAFVQGIVTLNDTFAFALGFSARRTDYFLGTTLLVILLSAVTAFLLVLLAFIESRVIVGWGVGLHFFSLPYVNDGSLAEQLWITFAVLMHMYFLGFVIGSIYRRFGKTGMWTFFACAFVLLSVLAFLATYQRWWNVLSAWLVRSTAFELALWLVPFIALYMLVAFVFLRKAVI